MQLLVSLESILCVELLAALRAGEGPWIAVHQLHVFALHRTGLESRATHFAEERSRRRMDCLMFHEVGVGAEHLPIGRTEHNVDGAHPILPFEIGTSLLGAFNDSTEPLNLSQTIRTLSLEILLGSLT